MESRVTKPVQPVQDYCALTMKKPKQYSPVQTLSIKQGGVKSKPEQYRDPCRTTHNNGLRVTNTVRALSESTLQITMT
ncbi:Hypothetical predicted protein [Mytilus galloprovincialis]|uniref:Uncharacterized protein n=1 Tax=Mytilus galloprovincialis TaxID=29158 RepID=A0A8B6FHC0_MYTGA|nr:Hypothetical predicted protein [Mytilus galloprovincialis]